MTYRSRPAPRRRQRARWQDELRTQRILIGAFAVAIAVALGLFGMSAWTAYHDAHLRQVIVVDESRVTREAFDLRQAIIGAELQASAEDLSGQLGGARDALLQQQLGAISDQFQNLTSATTNSIVDGLFQASRAEGYGITVPAADVDAEIEDRLTLPERVQLSLIEVDALPEDAEPGDEPTDEDFARAQGEANDILAELEAGVTSGPSPPSTRTTRRPPRPRGWSVGWPRTMPSTGTSSRSPKAPSPASSPARRGPTPDSSFFGSRTEARPARSPPSPSSSTPPAYPTRTTART
jgi:hypothetical protein